MKDLLRLAISTSPVGVIDFAETILGPVPVYVVAEVVEFESFPIPIVLALPNLGRPKNWEYR